MLANISNFDDITQYLSILNGSLLADIIVLLIVYYTPYFDSKYLMKWYEDFRLSAIIADVLILVIGIILARYFYYTVFSKYSHIKFIGLVVLIQVIHDMLFYLFFSSLPVGANAMFDLFKKYAAEVNAGAILGDSFMIIIATIASMYFATLGKHTNVISLIVMLYTLPYILYTK